MKFKLKELESLASSLNELVQIEMAQRTAYWLGRINKKINSELKEFAESSVKLDRKYGVYKYNHGKEVLTYKPDEGKTVHWENEKGDKVEGIQINPVLVYWKWNSEDDLKLHEKEMLELGEQEITIAFEPVKISDLVNGKGENISVKPRIIGELESIFTE